MLNIALLISALSLLDLSCRACIEMLPLALRGAESPAIGHLPLLADPAGERAARPRRFSVDGSSGRSVTEPTGACPKAQTCEERDAPKESAAGRKLFVAVVGDDAATGSLKEPLRTLEYAASQLEPGDTLYVRGGTYRQHHTTVRAQGEAAAPIAIRSYPGEEVVLDGSFPEFQPTGNSEWELVDGAVDLYRSKRTYTDGDWSGKFEHGGKLYALNEYKSLDALTSTKTTFDSDGVSYLGPGFLWNSSDKRIYIRLQAADPDAIYGRVFHIPSDADPRQNKVFISHHFYGFKFAEAEHVIVDGINVKHFDRPLFLGSGYDITVRNAVMVAGKTGAMLEHGVSRVTFEGLTFDAGLPPWIAWNDIKNGPQAASSLKLSGVIISGDVDGVRIANCRFVDVFDGITAVGGSTNLEIVHNEFDIVVDDAMQLGTAASNVEFAYNLMVGVGPSHDASGASLAPGTKYIHHNIIDARTETLYSRVGANNTAWRYRKPFPSHGSDKGPDPWKIYNNTILFHKNRNKQGAGHERNGPRDVGGPVHEVYNNIFLQLDDWRYSRGADVHDGAEIHDGNLYSRPTPSGSEYAFRNWVNGGTTDSFMTLAEFLASPFFTATRSYYSAGWESRGVEAAPRLRDPDRRDYRPAADGPAAAGGLDLSGKGWPGTSSATYRGAVDPRADAGMGQVAIRASQNLPRPADSDGGGATTPQRSAEARPASSRRARVGGSRARRTTAKLAEGRTRASVYHSAKAFCRGAGAQLNS